MPLLSTHHSSKLLICRKLRAKHYRRPAHVKAGFRGVIRHYIDNIYRKAMPGWTTLTTRTEKKFCLRVVAHLFFFSLWLSPLVVFPSTSTGSDYQWCNSWWCWSVRWIGINRHGNHINRCPYRFTCPRTCVRGGGRAQHVCTRFSPQW